MAHRDGIAEKVDTWLVEVEGAKGQLTDEPAASARAVFVLL